VTGKTQRTILIKWVRSGIGFTRRQKHMVRSLGLRRLHQVVEREDSPQVRGLVGRISHLVEIVDAAPRPPAWATVPEYTLLPKEVAAPEPAVERAIAPAAGEEVATPQAAAEAAEAATTEVAEETPAAAKETRPAKAAKAAKPAKAGGGKGKAAKTAKEREKKKAKPAAEKSAKSSKGSRR
jgi:large subunit ribosomal protein L30